MEPEPQRPLGITVLGIVGFAVAGWHLLLAMFALSYASSMVMIGALVRFPTSVRASVLPLRKTSGGFWWLQRPPSAPVGSVGLWMMQHWAYWLTVAAAGISLATHVLPGVQGVVTGSSTLGTLLVGRAF